MTALTKKKKVSKKNKSSWRKHVNIQDVEDYLEDRRLEERLGICSVKNDEELFVVDTQPDIIVKESSKQKKRLQLINKEPRCYEILKPHTKVADPVGERNHVKTVGSLPSDLSNISIKRRHEKGIYKKRLEGAAVNRKTAIANRITKRSALSDFERNIWNNEDKSQNDDLSSEWVSKEAKQNSLQTVCGRRRGPARAPSAALSTSKLPAIPSPHPGASYNPSYQDHQELLKEVADKELKVIKEEKHLIRVTTKMFQKINPNQRDQQWLEEMSSGIPKVEKATEEADAQLEESDSEYHALNPPVQNKKKSARQRRKLRENRAELDKIRRAKQEKKKLTQVYRLRKIESEIEKTEEKMKNAKVVRDQKKSEHEATGVKKLNAHKFQDPGEDFIMASELSGSLRTLNYGANLLRERYVSMQRRNILPPSRIYNKKKPKGKKYVKRTHKIPEKKAESVTFKK